MQLSHDQIKELKVHWPLGDEIKFHRRVANFVYFAHLNDQEVVLRLTEPIHRTAKEIASELDWMSYLTKMGMKIASPIPTQHGSLVAELSGDHKLIAAVFDKAPGSFLKLDEDSAQSLIETWGKYVGQMHRLTKDYQPASTIQPRQQWIKDESLAMALRSLDTADEIPYRRLNELIEWMKSLPQEKDSYGLIHCDLHQGNFFIDGGQITAFDFDDACYQWFSYDIVAPINSINKNLFEGTNNLEKETALKLFMGGYNQENNMDQIWIDRIQIFDKYRAALIYHWAKTCIKEKVFDSKALEWAKDKLPQLVDALRAPLRLF